MSAVKRSLGLMGLVGVLVFALAVPAMAVPSVVQFVGQAEVCADDVFENDQKKPRAKNCPLTKKDGSESGQHGLYELGQPGGKNTGPLGTRDDPFDTHKWTNRNGAYYFRSDWCGYVNPLDPDFDPLNPQKECDIEVDGKLAPVYGIGAACGMSNGHSGNGHLTTENGDEDSDADDSYYRLSNVGWPFSAAGTLPVTGDWELVAVGDGKKGTEGDTGKIVGLAQAQGGDACIKSDLSGKSGADLFDVIGAVELI